MIGNKKIPKYLLIKQLLLNNPYDKVTFQWILENILGWK